MTEFMSCPTCESQQEVVFISRVERANMKNVDVVYNNMTYCCTKCNQEFDTAGTLDENLARARNAYARIVNTSIAGLKSMLLRDVAALCQYEPIAQVLHDIRKANIRGVFFGGTLRSLMLARLQQQKLGRPRDIDIVVIDTELDELRKHSCNRRKW